MDDVKEISGKQEYTLVTREDDATGEIGWCLEKLAHIHDMPSVAIDPYLIAHDIIEHVNGIEEIGGIGEELQAMGGIWNTRGQHCDINRNNTFNNDPVVAVSSDITELGRRFLSGEDMGCFVPEYVDCGYEDDIDMIWEKSKDEIIDEMSYNDEEIDEDMLKEYESAFRSLFSLGVRKHEKMYGDRWVANNLFYYIVDEIGDKLTTTEDYEEIVVSIDYDEEEVSVYTKEMEYDYV